MRILYAEIKKTVQNFKTHKKQQLYISKLTIMLSYL